MVLSSSSFSSSLCSVAFSICPPSDFAWWREKIHVAISNHLWPAKAHICPSAVTIWSTYAKFYQQVNFLSNTNSGPKTSGLFSIRRVHSLNGFGLFCLVCLPSDVLFLPFSLIYAAPTIVKERCLYIWRQYGTTKMRRWCVCTCAVMHDAFVCEFSSVSKHPVRERGMEDNTNPKDTCCTLQIWWFSF